MRAGGGRAPATTTGAAHRLLLQASLAVLVWASTTSSSHSPAHWHQLPRRTPDEDFVAVPVRWRYLNITNYSRATRRHVHNCHGGVGAATTGFELLPEGLNCSVKARISNRSTCVAALVALASMLPAVTNSKDNTKCCDGDSLPAGCSYRPADNKGVFNSNSLSPRGYGIGSGRRALCSCLSGPAPALAALSVSPGQLVPAFGPAVLSYTVVEAKNVSKAYFNATATGSCVVHAAGRTDAPTMQFAQILPTPMTKPETVQFDVVMQPGGAKVTYSLSFTNANTAPALYSCVAGQCARASSGTYNTTDCSNNCSPGPPPTPIAYACIGVDGHATQCYGNDTAAWPKPPPDKDQQYSTGDCAGHCPEPPPSYSCAGGGQCILNRTGPFVTDRCEGHCPPPPAAGGPLKNLVVSAGSHTTKLVPPFDGKTMSYTDAVPQGTSSVTVTVTTVDDSSQVTIQGAVVGSGKPSPAIAVPKIGVVDVGIVCIDKDGTKHAYAIRVSVEAAKKTDASLQSLIVSTGGLVPFFDAKMYTYTDTLPMGTASVTVTAVVSQSTSKLQIQGQAIESGKPSLPVLLKPGVPAAITLLVTAIDGKTKQTYTISARAATDPTLKALSVTCCPVPSIALPYSTQQQPLLTSALFAGVNCRVISAGTLSPAFASGTTAYSDLLPAGTASVTVAAAPTQADSKMTIQGVAVATSKPSAPIAVNAGIMTHAVIVCTAVDGTNKTYDIATMAPPDASLKSLAVNAGSLLPAFNPKTAAYTDKVPVGTASLTVTAVTTQSTSKLTVQGAAVESGKPSEPIAMKAGLPAVVTIVCTAVDGKTKRTYTISAMAPDAFLKALSLSSGSLSPSFQSATTAYSDLVPAGVESVTVTATPNQADSKLMIQGQAVESGKPSAPIAIKAGVETEISVVCTSVGQQTVETMASLVGPCPTDFPFLTHAGPPLAGKICYKTAAEASAGQGPCGSWCTTDVKIGDGCGANTGHLCAKPGSSAPPPSPGFSYLGNGFCTGPAGRPQTFRCDTSGKKPGCPTTQPLCAALCAADAVCTAFMMQTMGKDQTTCQLVTTTKPAGSATWEVENAGKELVVTSHDEEVRDTCFRKGTEKIVVETYKISAMAPADASLKSLVVSSGSLAPAFESATTVYTDIAPAQMTSLTVTAVPTQADSKLTIQGAAVESGKPSAPIAIKAGVETEISVVCTSVDQTTVETYKISAMAPANASLKMLAVSSGSLSPAFESATTMYTDLAMAGITSVIVTAVPTEADSKLLIKGAHVVSNSSGPIAVQSGVPTEISIVVTAVDNRTTETYKVTVTVPPSLGSLSFACEPDKGLSCGTLLPPFSTPTLQYKLSPAGGVHSNASHLNVTATVASVGSGCSISFPADTQPPGETSGVDELMTADSATAVAASNGVAGMSMPKTILGTAVHVAPDVLENKTWFKVDEIGSCVETIPRGFGGTLLVTVKDSSSNGTTSYRVVLSGPPMSPPPPPPSPPGPAPPAPSPAKWRQDVDKAFASAKAALQRIEALERDSPALFYALLPPVVVVAMCMVLSLRRCCHRCCNRRKPPPPLPDHETDKWKETLETDSEVSNAGGWRHTVLSFHDGRTIDDRPREPSEWLD